MANTIKRYKVADDVFYEVVGSLPGGAELRRYTFFDRSVHSAIVVDGCIKEAAPIEREDYLVDWWEEKCVEDLVAWWEKKCEEAKKQEVGDENKTDDI